MLGKEGGSNDQKRSDSSSGKRGGTVRGAGGNVRRDNRQPWRDDRAVVGDLASAMGDVLTFAGMVIGLLWFAQVMMGKA